MSKKDRLAKTTRLDRPAIPVLSERERRAIPYAEYYADLEGVALTVVRKLGAGLAEPLQKKIADELVREYLGGK